MADKQNCEMKENCYHVSEEFNRWFKEKEKGLEKNIQIRDLQIEVSKLKATINDINERLQYAQEMCRACE